MTMKFWKWSKINSKILNSMLNKNNSAFFLKHFIHFFFVCFIFKQIFTLIYYPLGTNILPFVSRVYSKKIEAIAETTLTIFTHSSENVCDASSSYLDICIVKLDKS